MIRDLVYGVTAFLVVGLGACGDSMEPLATEIVVRDEALVSPHPSMSDPMDAVAARVPSFAGAYFDSTGDFVIRITGNTASRSEDVTEVLNHFLADHGPDLLRLGRADRQEGSVRVEDAVLSFAELRALQESSIDLLRVPGAFSLGVDESRGKIVVTVVTAADAQAVYAVAASLNLPPDILVVKVGGTPHLSATLSSKVRPVAGGLAINGCSLGFIAQKAGVRYLVTNSHCTPTYGQNDGTEFTQGSSEVVADESLDPAFSVLPDCPTGYTCRWADAILAKIRPGVANNLGRIKKTVRGGGTTEITGDLSITATGLYPFLGQVVDKIGKTTGWTYGTVYGTCDAMDLEDFTTKAPPNSALVCQYAADYSSVVGDSGGPVFQWTGGNTAKLYGITWAYLNWLSYFSPLGGIQNDLGTLTVY